MKIDKELYNKATEITYTNYEPVELLNDDQNYYVEADSIESMIEDLLYEIDSLQEKYDDLEQDLQDNYRPLPRSEYTGDSYDNRF